MVTAGLVLLLLQAAERMCLWLLGLWLLLLLLLGLWLLLPLLLINMLIMLSLPSLLLLLPHLMHCLQKMFMMCWASGLHITGHKALLLSLEMLSQQRR
jgi:hypothetical protein